MNTKTDEQEAREAGSLYGTMAADLSLVHVSAAATEEEVQKHIADLARNIREQAQNRAREGLGEDLATVGRRLPSKQLRPVWKPLGTLRIEPELFGPRGKVKEPGWSRTGIEPADLLIAQALSR